MRMRGKIKFYQEGKGFGFILSEENEDVFFHKTALINLYNPKKDDVVVFELRNGDRGKKAVNVQLLNGDTQ